MEEPETDAVSAAVERVLSAHLAKQQDVLLERLDSRMEALERQVAEENAKTIKLVTARFNEVTGLVQGSKASASPVAVQTSSTSSGSEADLQTIPSKITHVSLFSVGIIYCLFHSLIFVSSVGRPPDDGVHLSQARGEQAGAEPGQAQRYREQSGDGGELYYSYTVYHSIPSILFVSRHSS